MTRDCGHSAGDDQRLWTDIVQEMTRDCDTVQGMTRDCGHSAGDDQRLRTQCRG
ncbi:unnamed protein product [Staurois parvus]|uniref:Uncharacterized protein n=1 Tax=Staurois parvus TaxID=386267 RepID=A0ABN9CUA6_9NEOB|nr:unnamed protein product [Staurois parvus]